MSIITRRRFGGLVLGGTAAASTLGLTRAAFGQDARPRVVVIGGGAGGATAARYIAKDSQGLVDVTLIEPKKEYWTCFFSNLYLGGVEPAERISHSYEDLTAYGIKLVHQMADGIDADAKTVRLADGSDVPYDHLVVSPGIDFRYETVEGYGPGDEATVPHAWKAGEQTQLLKAQLEEMEDGGTFLLVPPPNPYRCPPGPYERASMVAHYFKREKPNSNILIVDTKEKFSKQGLFEEGWARHYGPMIEWLSSDFTGGPVEVDVAGKAVITEDGTRYEGAVMNFVPAQKAGMIAEKAGLTNETGFCPIEADSMASSVVPNVTVLGDSTIAGDMPKSGFSANSQAKVASMKIRHALVDQPEFPARYRNTCWSLIEENDCVKVGANYEPQDGKITATLKFISKVGEPDVERTATAEEAQGWYDSITDDMFGQT